MKCDLQELTNPKDISLVRALIEKYHGLGMPRGGGMAKGSRWFAWVCDGYIVAGAWLHLPSSFLPIYQIFKLDETQSYFFRRICRFAPGEFMLDFLEALSQKLRSEGKKSIVVLGYDDHSNALFKKAGYEQVGIVRRSGKPVLVKRLI